MRTNPFVVLAGLSMLAFVLAPADAGAQVDIRRSDRSRDADWRGDRDRDRRGPSVESLANRAERESNAFRAWFERNYDRRKLGRAHDNRWLKNEIQNLDEAMERVRSRADDRRPERGRAEVADALDHACRIDRELIFDNDRDTRFTVREWAELRLTLDRLARTYGVRRF